MSDGDVSPLGRLPCARVLSLPQKRLYIFSQCDFHFRFGVFEGTCLNSDWGLFTTSIPPIIRQPELALDAKKWRDPKRHSMISHGPSPAALLSTVCHDKPTLA
jgi:hypothetical protein